MDLKQIKQIIDLMKRSELSEFAVEEEGFKLKIRRDPAGQPVATTSRTNGSISAPNADVAPAPVLAAPVLVPTNGDTEEAGVLYIKSPMVGTFYRSPSPESKPYAEAGTKVTETSVVCIIEAMKIMNEIQAEVRGTIVELLVENGQPVEYGQRLFKVKST